MTTAASVACGMSASTGARNSSVANAAAATTSEAACVCAPALRFTAVWEVPPPAGIEPMNAPAAFAAPRARSSRFASMGGSARPDEGARRRDRLGEGDQGDAGGRRPHRLEQRGSRQHGHRKTALDRPHHAHAGGFESHDGRGGDAHGHGEQRRRGLRQEALGEDDDGQGSQGDGERGPREFRDVRDDRGDVAEEALLVDVDAEQLGQLVDDDDEADPRLESGQHRFRNEIGQESEPQDARSEEHRADENGERRRRGERIERRVRPQRFADRGRAQDRDRRGGADAQQARGAQNGVDGHRHQRREQARLHGQLRDGRVGERLRHDDGRGREAGYQVRGEVPAPVAFAPFGS